MEWKKIVIGLIILSIAVGIIYVASQDNVRIRVDKYRSTFYVLEDSRWRVAGREYFSIFDGTSKMYRRPANITVETEIYETAKAVKITRVTPYIRGPVVKDTYLFDGTVYDKRLFPIYHKIEIYNSSGKFFRYEVRDLTYNGSTYKLNGETELRFGKNMTLRLHPGYRWAWVYKTGIAKAQYDINSDYEVFNVRLFDPEEAKRLAFTEPIPIHNAKRQFIENENVYMSVYPESIYRSQYVYFEFSTKSYSGNMDIAFGFNTDKAQPKSGH